MRQWIVTGYSGKMDGLLYVVEADTEEAAIRAVGEINETIYRDVSAKGLNGKVLCCREMKDEDILDELEHGEPRWFWQMWAQELKVGSNHRTTVCW